MPDLYERFFGYFGHEPADLYELKELDPYYRVFYKDDIQIDVVADLEEMVETFESVKEGAGANLREYMEYSEREYELVTREFMYKFRHACGIGST